MAHVVGLLAYSTVLIHNLVQYFQDVHGVLLSALRAFYGIGHFLECFLSEMEKYHRVSQRKLIAYLSIPEPYFLVFFSFLLWLSEKGDLQ